jgi:hypothetical protein
MNYTVVINSALWGGALLYYYLYAWKFFKGPKTTVEDDPPNSQESVVPVDHK